MPSDRNEYKNQWRRERVERGLCRDCSNPLVMGYIRCASCLLKDAQNKKEKYHSDPQYSQIKVKRQRAIREERVENNQCPRCGKLLIDDDGDYCICCLIDRDSLLTGKRGVYREVNN